MKSSNVCRWWRLAAGTIVVLCGACITVDTTPPPEAILAGTWQLTTEQTTELTQTFFTFDSAGQLDKVTYKIGDNATITDNSPRGTVSVSGASVTIDATFAGSGQIINGTLNDENDVITGDSGTVIRFLSIEINVDNGAITLTKQ